MGGFCYCIVVFRSYFYRPGRVPITYFRQVALDAHAHLDPRDHSLAESFDYCSTLTLSHYENFPVGSFLIPKLLRPHVYSIYAFARIADDFADEPGMEPPERLSRLDEWGENLSSCLESPKGPVFTALAETIRVHEIPIGLLTDLLHAFRSDVTTSRHQTFTDLLNYCRYSANPVGRLVLHLFGYQDPGYGIKSDAICTALQLTNFWQDIAIDFSRDRIYLPVQEMVSFGVSEEHLTRELVTSEFRDLMISLINRTRDLYLTGSDLPNLVKGRLKYELRLTWLGGNGILDRIVKADYDIFRCRPKLRKWDMLSFLLKSLISTHRKKAD